ncbi:MAG: dolichyl-phosphate beta-glucosyltransferase [Patescibacteria group bacterium]|mgnify:CR=1 FL=1
MLKDIFLSIVIPAYNEEKNIRSGVLKQVYDYLQNQDYTWEVLIVDDGSTDKTLAASQEMLTSMPGFKVLQEPHRGKGGTVIAGVLAAQGKYIVFTDADQSTPINQLEKFLPKLQSDYDIVIGSRSGRAGAPVFRKLMSLGFSTLRTIVLRLPYKDTQTGFKGFKRQPARNIFGLMKKFFENKHIKGASTAAGFDVEMLYIARKMGYKIAEVPVDWVYEPGTKKNPFKESWIGFKGMMAVRIKSLLGVYKIK